MLRKRSERQRREALFPPIASQSRRDFLRNSGIAAVGVTAASGIGPIVVKKAHAQQPRPSDIKRIKTVCPFCAVGCSIWAEVENGAWIGQEPVFESPVNMGTHCAKGAAARELAIGERRLKYPTKLEGGRWKRISWEEAIEQIGDKLLQIREESGPEAVYWLGSAKFSNEQAYLMRKFAAFWGTNNVDHQARICHSTTVSGVANMYGYGAMTNSFNDMHQSKSIFLLGGNPAEAHPVSMLHLLHAKENGAKFIVVDPRFTRTAAHATEYVRIRPGTDVAFLWGVLWHILQNGWEDKEYIQSRVFGFEEARKVVDRYPPEEVERITGVPQEQIERVARTLAENRPGTLIWCMGLTQSHIGNNKTRAASVFQLALGNIGKSGGGANIFRGHDNVQGATDMCLMCHTLPAYYGLTQTAWDHWARVWDVDYQWLRDRFASKELMELQGMPDSRWFDGVLEAEENLDQPTKVRAMFYWGHAPNSQTRGPDLKKALNALDLLVVIDPVPTVTAAMHDRQDGVYLLPAGSTMEYSGSVTNSQRALQWRETVIEPIFDAKNDYEITYLLARKLGFEELLFKHIAVENGKPLAEDITREWNRGSWTIGYTGQSPERMKLHMQHQDKFDTATTLGMSEPVKGEYYGMPWPCWGPAEMGHPGTPLLYRLDLPVAKGGLPFRARWGVVHQGQNLLAEGTYTEGSELKDGYPEMTYAVLEKLGWVSDLTRREQLVIAAIAAGAYSHDMLTMDEAQANTRLQQLLQEHAPIEPEPRQAPGQPGAGQLGQAAGGDRTREQMAQAGQGAVDRQLMDVVTQSGRAGEVARTYLQFSPNPDAAKARKEQAAGDEQPVSTDNNGKQAGGSKEGEDVGEADFGGHGEGGQTNQQPSESFAQKLLKVNWKTDLSGGIQRVAVAHGVAPFGNGKARALVWNFPDPIPVHREPLYTPRRDLLPKYRTYDDRRDYRLPVLYWSIQKENFADQFPLVLTTGRLVEYEGGGDETRANKWLAEFQQEMFAEVNPADAEANGISPGSFIWLHTPEGARVKVAALVTNRVGKGTVFMPFHFAGWFQGEDLSAKYPEGTVPFVVGEAANTSMTYGYDVVTFMQESKVSLCRIESA